MSPILAVIILTSSFLFALLSPCTSQETLTYVPKIRGMFVFGSSLVDNGNNNFVQQSLAKANYFPYGIDFPLGPSGRFTNGKNVVDLLGEKLKLGDYIPPFNDPSTKGNKIMNGVNYASGGSGILDSTGSLAGNVISLNQQIRNFEEVTLPELMELQNIDENINGNKTNTTSSEFLFVIGSGGNDYSLNYFVGLTNNNVTVEDFTANLTTTLASQIKKLYELGARKFVLMAINPNGCSPMATSRAAGGRCVRALNRAVHMFNVQLRNLVDEIRPRMPGSNLVVVNAYKVIMNIIRFPQINGFRNVNESCCQVSRILCSGGGEGSICERRNEYVFFDGLHPTEAVNAIIANKAFESQSQAEVYPYNVMKLAQS